MLQKSTQRFLRYSQNTCSWHVRLNFSLPDVVYIMKINGHGLIPSLLSIKQKTTSTYPTTTTTTYPTTTTTYPTTTTTTTSTYPTATGDLGTLYPPPILRQEALATPPVRTQDPAQLNNALLSAELLVLGILQGKTIHVQPLQKSCLCAACVSSWNLH